MSYKISICDFCEKLIEVNLKREGKHNFCGAYCQRNFQKRFPHEFRDCACKEEKQLMRKRMKTLWENPDYRKKMVESHRGKKLTGEQKKKIGKASKLWHKLHPKYNITAEGIRKMSFSLRGKVPWNKGMRSPESERKKSEAQQRVSRPEWFKIAREVRRRDNYHCQECGCLSATSVHHVTPWKESKDDSSENLTTLCRSCHRKTEIWNSFLSKIGASNFDFHAFWNGTTLSVLERRKNYLMNLTGPEIKTLIYDYQN